MQPERPLQSWGKIRSGARHDLAQATTGSRADRARYQDMIADAKARRFDVLLVDDISRLSRDQVEAQMLRSRLAACNISKPAT